MNAASLRSLYRFLRFLFSSKGATPESIQSLREIKLAWNPKVNNQIELQHKESEKNVQKRANGQSDTHRPQLGELVPP